MTVGGIEYPLGEYGNTCQDSAKGMRDWQSFRHMGATFTGAAPSTPCNGSAS